MVILDLFTKSIATTYKSTFFSKATFITLIFRIICVVVPFVFAYKSKGFWIKRDEFYEQPTVKFTGEYIFLGTTSNLTKPLITCSTLTLYEKKFENFDSCSIIKVREIDKNFDNKVEELVLNLKVNLPLKTQLTSISIIISLDYRLHSCPLQMQSAAVFQMFLPFATSETFLISDIRIAQSAPLSCHTNSINSIYNYSVVESSDEIGSYDLNHIITQYAKRNISTIATNIYRYFVPGHSRNFLLNFILKFPEDKLYYSPGFWQIIKWAWIQYLSIYLIVAWVVTKIQTYIFSRRLVLFYEDNPLKKKQ